MFPKHTRLQVHRPVLAVQQEQITVQFLRSHDDLSVGLRKFAHGFYRSDALTVAAVPAKFLAVALVSNRIYLSLHREHRRLRKSLNMACLVNAPALAIPK